MYRSTKGASKARRDQINAEIRNLKDLLPISEADKARLSYLHIMSLACMYTRKSVFFSQGSELMEESGRFLSFHELAEFVQTLPGFLLVITSEGKLLYLSENVADHLGHSMVDLVAQGDSVYDIIDPSDHFVMRSNLAAPPSDETERLFRCRFNTSKSVRRQSAGNKLVLVRGRFLQPPAGSYWSSNPVFIAFGTPLEPRPRHPEDGFFFAFFESQHSKDMSIMDVSDNISMYLGYDKSDILCKSWYSLVHPQDLSHASALHYRLINESSDGKVEMVVRLQAKDTSWVWVYIVLQTESTENPITCFNYIISESEACSLRQQLASEESQLAFVLRATASYQESLLMSPGQLSSPDQVFTPLSSTPTSGGGLSVQSFDFSTVCNVEFTEEAGSSIGVGTASLGQEESMQLGGNRPSISSVEEEPSPTTSSHHLQLQQQQQSKALDFYTQNLMFLPSNTPTSSSISSSSSYDQTSFRAESHQGQAKESVCTPPYTPQQGGCSFVFGTPDTAFPPATTTNPSETETTTTTTSTAEMYYSLESCSAIYEKLPPTPDSPNDGDCIVMTVPEVRGPLYIDVPMVPEGLLTPEASPIKQPFSTFFGYSEKERSEINILAEQISTLAEDFSSYTNVKGGNGISYSEVSYAKHNQVTRSSSLPAGMPAIPLPSDANLSTDFYPLKQWKSIDFSLLAEDASFFEENIFETILKDLSSSSISSSTPLASAKSESQLVVRCSPPHLGGGIDSTSSPLSLDTADPCVETAHSSSVAVTASAAMPLSPPSTDLSPEEQSFLEELASYETVFETRASRSPCDGFNDELYQLRNHMEDSFHHGEPPFIWASFACLLVTIRKHACTDKFRSNSA
ncbi:neuronal PAS domain-containing protein 4A isoform X1 [Erpetoichthys calabaricus]|uniref:neuronal PAS domain-containing protein 4A isoform X1 n=1 Tax=Erpetoichthys calabaricus TaxID=27687 RepID=UPI002234CDBD|nr:neuronal PAS domain-containing protein 4A isoform X1 [Erpetoichthys calabaricus]